MPQETGAILVAENDPILRETVGLALQGAGHLVDAAGDGAQALDLLHQGHYRALLLDLMLPRLDGFAELQRLRAEPALRPAIVLILSALQRRADVLAALEAGADDYLTKPFELDDLTLRLEMWLRRTQDRAAIAGPYARWRLASPVRQGSGFIC